MIFDAFQPSMGRPGRSRTVAVRILFVSIGWTQLAQSLRQFGDEGPLAQSGVEMARVQFLTRWQPDGEALYHRRLGLQWHDMCAESLGMPKVALCFLTRGPVHQEAMWRQWVQQVEGLVMLPDAEAEPSNVWTKQERMASHRACVLERRTQSNAAKRQHMFTVYTHPTDPAFKGYRPGSVFYGSEVGNRLPSTAYASYDLVEAGRSLIAAALQDRLNQRFVHLSESCIPLYPPALIYMQLLHEQKSRVNVENPHKAHWTQNQWKPALETVHGLNRTKHWRKGSHWRALIRKHAQLAADDRQLVNAFSQDCKTCHVPERYFQMLLALHGLQNETFPNGWLTWVDWSRTDPSGWHPWDADADSIDEELLFIMRTTKVPNEMGSNIKMGSLGSSLDSCKAAWDSAPLALAEKLLQSYASQTDGWSFKKESSTAGTTSKGFTPLQHECLLFARKFKADTVAAVLDMFSHPQFSSWNYTGERMVTHFYDRR